METPENWLNLGSDSMPHMVQTIVRFVCPTSDNTQLLFRFRGHPVDPDSGRQFIKLLQANQKMLLPSEMQSIQTIINDINIDSDFRILAARLESINGRKVVTLQGRWWESAMDALSIYIAADDEGSYIQEIHYLAPKDEFASHMPVIKRALASIQWKPKEGESDRGGIFKVRRHSGGRQVASETT